MKKNIKSICFSLLAFMFAIGSIFLPVGQQNQKYASADTTTLESPTFYSSDIMFAFTPYYSDIDYDFNTGSGTSDNVNYNASQSILQYSFALKSVDMGTGYSIGWYFNGQFDDDTYLYNPTGFNDTSIGAQLADLHPFGNDTSLRDKYYGLYFSLGKNAPLKEQSFDVYFNYLIDGTNKKVTLGCGVDMSNRTSDFPSLNMVSVEIGSTKYNDVGLKTHYYDVDGSQVVNYYTSCNIVKYTDTHGYEFYFYIPCYITESSDTNFYYKYRKYLLNGAFDFSDNSYYQQGIIDGKSQGYDNGYNDGYFTGQKTGYDNGFETGKLEGALESNNYSFFGLISAVIDAPVKILTSLFNFNFLGVNLWAFFTSILTISLIVFVIRKFMAKG